MSKKLFGVAMALGAVLFGIFWMSVVSSIGAPSFFSMFGIVFIIVAIFILLRTVFSRSGRRRMSRCAIPLPDYRPRVQMVHGDETRGHHGENSRGNEHAMARGQYAHAPHEAHNQPIGCQRCRQGPEQPEGGPVGRPLHRLVDHGDPSELEIPSDVERVVPAEVQIHPLFSAVRAEHQGAAAFAVLQVEAIRPVQRNVHDGPVMEPGPAMVVECGQPTHGACNGPYMYNRAVFQPSRRLPSHEGASPRPEPEHRRHRSSSV